MHNDFGCFMRPFFAYRDQQLHEEMFVFADKKIIRKQLSVEAQPDWFSRALYLGFEGAKAWNNVSLDPQYQNSEQKKLSIDILASILNSIRARTFVSLGPGEGSFDLDLVKKMTKVTRDVCYIPVDISDGLLFNAINKLSSVVRVPFGVLTDFEERHIFLKKQLDRYNCSSTVFSLLGNTLGNLDKSEKSFFESFSEILNSEDNLLLNISIISDGWTPKKDPRLQYEKYTQSIKIFLSRAVYQEINESIEHLTNNFDCFVGLRHRPSQKKSYSEKIEIYNKQNNKLITKIDRYRLNEFRSWIDNNTDFRVTICQQLFTGDVVGQGYLLLVKK